MSEIVRTKNEAKGGLTPEEEIALKSHTDKWIANAYKTGPADKEKLTEAIKGIYKVSGLKEPRVVTAPSPMVMVFAYGASCAIFDGDGDGDGGTRNATDHATLDAARNATRNATETAILLLELDLELELELK